MAEVQTLGDSKAAAGWKGTWHCLFFRRQLFYYALASAPFQNYIWPVRLISTRSSPQSRTFSCHDSRGRIDPGGVVKPFMDANPFLSPVTVLSHGGEFNKSKVK